MIQMDRPRCPTCGVVLLRTETGWECAECGFRSGAMTTPPPANPTSSGRRLSASMTFYAPPEIVGRLRALSDSSKVPVAVLLREAVAARLPAWEAQAARGERLTFEPSEGWEARR